nr:uncharacterized protein LOC109995164 [Labrus bergylta]
MNGSQYIWILNGVLMQNVALSRTADQSSSHPDGPARNAVDGNRDPNFAKGSCSLTHQESNPWWRVDLQNVYTVTAVMITNRNEFENRLDGAEIWIGNSLEDNGAKKSRCAIISHIPKGRTFYFPCSSTEGRYVTVFLPGTKKILTLCDVQVFPLDSNLALRGKAFQSSTLSNHDASRAIDGRRDSNYGDGFCTHTLEETNPWWRLDLRETHAVTSVKVTNRGDCCAQRLDGAEIRIGNSAENNGNDNPKCASISHIGEGKTVTFYCEGGSVMGRFVNVIIPGPNNYLTLCEVEVYADTAPPPPATESMLLNGRNVTVVGERLCWSDALLYCRRHHWDLLSILSREEQSEVEQLLSRGSFLLTDHVWLGLRRQIMGDSWFWMSGEAMDFTKWQYDSAPNV